MLRRLSAIVSVLGLLSACGGDDADPQPAPPANAPPSFTSAAAATVTSGATGTILTATARDADNDPLTFSISGGADQSLFQLGQGGALSFRTPPDAAAPADQNRDNVYLVVLGVSDGKATTTQEVSVTVTGGAAGFRVRRVAAGFSQPVFLAPVPTDDRVFVVERAGLIRILEPATGATAATPFLDVRAETSTEGERGLLGFATAPDYASSGSFYVFLTNRQGDIEVRRYRRSAGNPDLADAASADLILTVPHPGFTNHYGGWIGFGPEGNLYVATGDGGGSGDPDDNAQNRNRLLGKILRIDPRGDSYPADPARDYAIPDANPFAGGGGAPEVLALGLRNPFRASFDGAALFIGDVGQNAVEEIDLLTVDGRGPAANFGWPILEGTRIFRAPATTGFTAPVAEYLHGTGPLDGESVTGGLVYRGPIASLQGSYFFADFIRQRLWSVPRDRFSPDVTLPASSFVDRLSSFAPDAGAYTNIVSFGTDRQNNLFIVDFDGEIFMLERGP